MGRKHQQCLEDLVFLGYQVSQVSLETLGVLDIPLHPIHEGLANLGGKKMTYGTGVITEFLGGPPSKLNLTVLSGLVAWKPNNVVGKFIS